MFLNGKRWIPAGLTKSAPQKPTINQSVSELMKPLGEKTWKGNVWGSVIVNVEKDGEPTPQPTPTPSATPVPTWNPSQLSNLYDWWNTTSGITTSGTNLVSWEGYNGTLFTPQSVGTDTQVEDDGNWNGYDAVILNYNSVNNLSNGLSATTSSSATSKTLIMVAKLIDYSSTNSYLPLFGIAGSISSPPSRITLFGRQDLGQFDGFNNAPDSETLFGTIAEGDYLFSMMTYDTTIGEYKYYSSTGTGITNLYSGTDAGQLTGTVFGPAIQIGTYSAFGPFDDTSKLSVVEFIALDGVITPSELSNLTNYLNNKYYNIPLPTPTPTPTPTQTGTPTPTPSATPTLDPDASTFLSAVVSAGGTVDSTITSATNTLFSSLKSNGLYSKLRVMYPIIGNNINSFAINAKNPGSYNATWYNSPGVSLSGVTFNGTSSYGDSGWSSSVEPAIFSAGTIGYFVNQANTVQYGGNFMAIGGGGFDRWGTFGFDAELYMDWGLDGFYNRISSSSTPVTGAIIMTSTGATPTSNTIYRNGTSFGTADAYDAKKDGADTFTNTLQMGRREDGYYSDGRYAFFFIGEYMNSTEVTTMSNIINTFQTSLSRNI